MRILSPETAHKDSRRELKQLFTADIKQVNSYDVNKGTPLGNHYHKVSYEYFYVTKGLLMVRIGDNTFPANPGTLFCVEPNEFHTVEALSNKASFITFLTKAYSKEDTDTYK